MYNTNTVILYSGAFIRHNYPYGPTVPFLISSYNGTTYSEINPTTLFCPEMTRSIAGCSLLWGGNMWVWATSPVQEAGIFAKIIRSYNGIDWTYSYINTSVVPGSDNVNANLSELFYNGSIWLLICNNMQNVLYSYDTINWMNSTSYNIEKGSLSVLPTGPIRWGQNKWIAMVSGSGVSQNFLMSSTDGINWVKYTQNFPTDFPTIFPIASSIIYYDIKFNGSKWIMLVNGSLLYSLNGINWNLCNASAALTYAAAAGEPAVYSLAQVFCIGYNETMWVAGCDDIYYRNAPIFIYSFIGIDWLDSGFRKLPGYGPYWTDKIGCGLISNIVWNGSLFIANVDQTGGTYASVSRNPSGQNMLLISSDGINWSWNGTNLASANLTNNIFKGGFKIIPQRYIQY